MSETPETKLVAEVSLGDLSQMAMATISHAMELQSMVAKAGDLGIQDRELVARMREDANRLAGLGKIDLRRPPSSPDRELLPG